MTIYHVIVIGSGVGLRVLNAMSNRDKFESITQSMHIFQALSELIPETLNHLE